MRFRPAVFATLQVAFCTVSVFGQAIDFNRDVRPILSNRCLACHGPDQAHREGGLRLDDAAIATSPLDSGETAVVPGKPDASELLNRVLHSDESLRMPPAKFGKPLTESEISVLRQWIEQGAPFAKHWSYVKPERPEVPAVEPGFSHWPKNAIDHFALQRMLSTGLKPSQPAEASAIVRRLFLDLIGVPPTLEEANEWISRLNSATTDRRDDVYGELVDHLLDRPEFGEHWARKWLDLARYADSSGYADDPARTIWPWRDWVIRAINSNMPFDQFTIEQLAGDMLPAASEDQLIATAFHRNTMTNNEGGTQDEEFRNVAVVDRVNTTMAVWMGTTLACAQCHDHKYDPLSQEEYFRVFAILNNTQDADRGDDSPRLPLYSTQQRERKATIEARLTELDDLFATPTDVLNGAQAAWEERLQANAEWSVIKPSKVSRVNDAEVVIAEDGIVTVPTATEKDMYTIDLPLAGVSTANSSGNAAAIRLETLPSELLPGKGSGHGGGNFVITELKLQLVPNNSSTPRAQFVRIEIPGKTKILSLAEVQVLSAGKNVAVSGKASQSSTDFGGPAELAIDGNTDGQYENKSVTHTSISDNPWWELDLGAMTDVESVVLWNRLGPGLIERLSDFRIILLDSSREEVWAQQVAKAPNPSAEFSPSSIRDLPLIAAVADFQQDGFAPEEVLDGKTEPENGWAVGGKTGEPHALTLILKSPVAIDAETSLRLILEQKSPYANHLVGRFRLSLTDDSTVAERASLPSHVSAIVDKARADRTPDELTLLAAYFRDNAAAELSEPRKERLSLRNELTAMKPETSVPILRELGDTQRRKTHLQHRGNYLDKGVEVAEGVPAVFPPIAEGTAVDRLALAQWLVSDENPLTARVLANRYWENLFGRGIVGTSEEFGSQGDLPTHPELLDWMATELMQSRWNTKALLRTIVLSATYRQSSVVTPETAAADSENRWLARGPRVRLSAEMVRDQSLLVSGLLSRKMYGAPVKPPQPSSGLSAAFGSSTDWQTSQGEDRYRRAIYTTWRRSNPYPSMATFDAPNREVCTLKRNRTNTPLQALVTMNDPVYVEAAQALARVILSHQGSASEQLRYGFERCTLRKPTEQELQALVELLADVREEMEQAPDDAMKLATDPLGPLPTDMSPSEAAAMTVVGNVLLNLDEMLLKR